MLPPFVDLVVTLPLSAILLSQIFKSGSGKFQMSTKSVSLKIVNTWYFF